MLCMGGGDGQGKLGIKKKKKKKNKNLQYLYVWNVFNKTIFSQDKNGIVIDVWDPSVLPKYIGKIKIEEPNA